MSDIFWGFDRKTLRIFQDEKQVAEVNNRFEIIVPYEERKNPSDIKIEKIPLADSVELFLGVASFVMCQAGINSEGSRKWLSIIIPRARIVSLKFEMSPAQASVDIQGEIFKEYTDEEPDPLEILRKYEAKE